MTDRPPHDPIATTLGHFPDLKSLMTERFRSMRLPRERIDQLTRVVESEFFRIYQESLGDRKTLPATEPGRLSGQTGANGTKLFDGRWTAQESDRPLLLMIGGVSGAGKSTLAAEVSRRLAIPHVISTDFIRQRMRALFPREIMPAIHCSSFEVGAAAVSSGGQSAEATLRGFFDQARHILMGLGTVLGRSLADCRSVTVEGVHIVPGWMPPPRMGATVVQCLLVAANVEAHVTNFWLRSAASRHHRSARRYLRSLSEIRRIQDCLIQEARKFGVAVIETSSLEEDAESVIRLVRDKVDERTWLRGRGQVPGELAAPVAGGSRGGNSVDAAHGAHTQEPRQPIFRGVELK